MVRLTFASSELEAVREQITDFIVSQHDAAGANGAVIGLSGGIDSSLVATLAVEALGPDRVHGLSLPADVSAPRHRDDAVALAEDLGMDCDVIDVEPIVETLVAAAPVAVDERARGNARARVRAVLNYLVSNAAGGRLVLGTGNRSEALVGYFTKFGDGAVDCHPIGNLYKCQVRQLARHVGVPVDIVEKTPTAELWEDHTDEDELGLSYDTLDAVLALHVDGPLSAAATAETIGCGPDVVAHVDGLVAASAHKRTMPPAPDP